MAEMDGTQHGRTLRQEEIHEIFEFYANFGRSSVMTYQTSLDNFMFMKVQTIVITASRLC